MIQFLHSNITSYPTISLPTIHYAPIYWDTNNTLIPLTRQKFLLHCNKIWFSRGLIVTTTLGMHFKSEALLTSFSLVFLPISSKWWDVGLQTSFSNTGDPSRLLLLYFLWPWQALITLALAAYITLMFLELALLHSLLCSLSPCISLHLDFWPHPPSLFFLFCPFSLPHFVKLFCTVCHNTNTLLVTVCLRVRHLGWSQFWSLRHTLWVSGLKGSLFDFPLHHNRLASGIVFILFLFTYHYQWKQYHKIILCVQADGSARENIWVDFRPNLA